MEHHIGYFLVELYHENHFGYDGLIKKRIVREKFRDYLKRNNLEEVSEVQDKVGTILQKYGYLLHTEKGCGLFKIKNTKFREFYRELLKKMDENQKKLEIETSSEKFDTENKDDLVLSINNDENVVLYQREKRVKIEENFRLTNTGCFICQKNFPDEESYGDHIEYHGEASGFKSVSDYLINKSYDFELTYRTCFNSFLLCFTLKTIRKNLIIEKIIIVRAKEMSYVRNKDVPFAMPEGGTDDFFVDRHLFYVGIPQPIVIVYKYKNELSYRRIAQYLFIRSDEFPFFNMKLRSTRVISRDEMKITKKLGSYFPPDDLKFLCNSNNFNEYDICQKYPKMREYLESKEIRASSMIDIFKILVYIEDITKCNRYKKLNRTNFEIKGYCGEYSVTLDKITRDCNPAEILKPFDEICLTYEKPINKDKYDVKKNMIRKKKIFCNVYRVYGKKICFQPRERSTSIELNQKYDISFSPGRLPITYQFRALQILNNKENIRRLLFPTINFNKIPVELSLNFYNHLVEINPEQKQAVMNIVDGSNKSVPYIIFGPPGTGKTTTVVESVFQLWKVNKDNRILVTAGSNAACDEVARKLCDIFAKVDQENLNVLRIYAATVEKRIDNMDENLLEISNLCHNYHFYPSIDSIKSYRIIIATLTVVGKLVLAEIGEKYFTHIFIDECAASTEPESLVGIAGVLSKDARLILSGDPKQLGPVLESEKASELGLSLSLMERLLKRKCYEVDENGKYDQTIQTRLVRNFRTHPDILYLSNSLYYGGELVACAKPEVTNWTLGWHRLPSKKFPIIFNVVYGQTKRDTESKSSCNYKELSVILDYVKSLMFFGVNGRKIVESDIGIISPYRKQCDLIREELDTRRWYKIEVGSVEVFQGKEKPIIIISMVRSDTAGVGFLSNPRRTNVALTRAQTLMIIIGNPETLEKIDDWKEVIEYCKNNNAFTGAKYPREITNFKSSQSSLSTITTIQLNGKENKNRRSRYRRANSRDGSIRNAENEQRKRAIFQPDTISLNSHLEENVTNWLEQNAQFRKKYAQNDEILSYKSSICGDNDDEREDENKNLIGEIKEDEEEIDKKDILLKLPECVKLDTSQMQSAKIAPRVTLPQQPITSSTIIRPLDNMIRRTTFGRTITTANIENRAPISIIPIHTPLTLNEGNVSKRQETVNPGNFNYRTVPAVTSKIIEQKKNNCVIS